MAKSLSLPQLTLIYTGDVATDENYHEKFKAGGNIHEIRKCIINIIRKCSDTRKPINISAHVKYTCIHDMNEKISHKNYIM